MRFDVPTEALAVATPNIYIITRDPSQAYMPSTPQHRVV